MRNAVLNILALAWFFQATLVSSADDVASYFTTGDEGWKTVELHTTNYANVVVGPYGLGWSTNAGNPDGCIGDTDQNGDTLFYFNAPTNFHGDRGGCYAGSLSFDLWRDSSGGTPTDLPDVVLVGVSNTLVIDAGPTPPVEVWTPYTVALTETAGWHKDSLSGPTPIAAEFHAVLTNLKELRIRGDLTAVTDGTRLDNIVLREGCPPASIRLSEVEICWFSASNATYQVDFRSDLTTNTWVPLFTNITGTGQEMCVYDKIAREAPQRFYRVACPSE